MIDLHVHLLPGIDDGAGDLDEAVAMCRRAAETGCKGLIATPHQRVEHWWNDELDELARLLKEVQDAVGPSPRLFPGAEIRIDNELLDALDDPVRSGILSLAGSRYLLLEFERRRGHGPDPESLIHELVVAGWRPILAHPELIDSLSGDLDLVGRLVDLGAHLQVTAMSLTGGFGAKVQRITGQLIGAELVDFVASDAHGIDWRPPGLLRAYGILEATWGKELARKLTSTNPRAVLVDQPVGRAVSLAPVDVPTPTPTNHN